MPKKSGGAAPRMGFNYQDYVASYCFIYNENIDELHVERYSADIAHFSLSADPPRRVFYEIKASDTGPLTWSKFKSDIAPEFAAITTNDDDTTLLLFYIVSNTKPNENLNSFLTDAEKLGQGIMQWHGFKTRQERRLDTLQDAIERKTDTETDEATVATVVNGLRHRFHSQAELESKIENRLQNLSPGRHKSAKQTILNEIHETSSGAIRRAEIENKIGFDLDDPVGSSTTGATTSPEKIQDSLADMQNRYKSESKSIDVTEPAKDKKLIGDWAQYESKNEAKSPALIEGIQTNIDEELSRVEEARRNLRSASQNIVMDLSNVIEADDSTESTREEDNE